MSKRNKVRYQVKEKTRVTLALTGNVFLQYRDDEEAQMAQKGDVLVFASNEPLHTTRQGAYDETGFTGYFKVDVSDGKNWQPLLLNAVFPHEENHFSKTERPMDTFHLCEETLQKLAGKTLVRTYREHYELEE